MANANFFSRNRALSSEPEERADSSPGSLERQQALLLARVRRARGAAVSYEELRDAGIEFPASVASELELAGLPIEHWRGRSPGDIRVAGVRLDPAREVAQADVALAIRQTNEAARGSLSGKICAANIRGVSGSKSAWAHCARVAARSAADHGSGRAERAAMARVRARLVAAGAASEARTSNASVIGARERPWVAGGVAIRRAVGLAPIRARHRLAVVATVLLALQSGRPRHAVAHRHPQTIAAVPNAAATFKLRRPQRRAAPHPPPRCRWRSRPTLRRTGTACWRLGATQTPCQCLREPCRQPASGSAHVGSRERRAVSPMRTRSTTWVERCS